MTTNLENLSNAELEAEVLAAVLAENTSFYRLASMFDGNVFFDPLHVEIWEDIRSWMQTEGYVNKALLARKQREVKTEKGKQYLATLQNFGELACFGLSSKAKVLNDLSLKRRALLAAQEFVAAVSESEMQDSFEPIVAEFYSKMEKTLSGANDNSVKIRDAGESILRRLTDESDVLRYDCGLRPLNDALGGGFEPGRVYSISALPKIGKTMIASTISCHLNDTDCKHLFVCAELDAEEIATRMLGQSLDLSSNDLSRNTTLVAEHVSKMKNNIIFENEPGIEFDRLKLLVEKHVLKNKITGFILDYYQLVGGASRDSTQAQHLENVANWIHRVCKKHKIWSLILVQLNDEKKIYGSRGLNRACDQSYILERVTDEEGDPVGS